MPDPSYTIEQHLSSSDLRNSLTPLFTQTLAWGAPTGQSRLLDLSPSAWGGDNTLQLTIRPVAQLSGVPVFRVDWPFLTLPNLSQRRAVYKALSTSHLEHLLCYVTDDNRQAAFVWARSRNGKVELRTLPYEAGTPARTTLDQIANLAFTYQELGMFGEPSPTLVLDKLNNAFDVEAVTKRFFKQYAETFDHVESLIKGIPAEEKARKRLFTQRLFNRLMFIAFIQRKGWLKLGPTRDYLAALWNSYHRDPAPTGDFYNSRLRLLFFVGLNNQASQDFTQSAAGVALREVIGDVPYLNGGLFEELPDDKDPAISIPDNALDAILNDLFSCFNFTITESTPLDVEVAVDPEMLGKVFEELVTNRHEGGAYYTPKPIVSFMCREALKGYLKRSIPADTSEAIDAFVDTHIADSLRDPEAVLAALKRVTVCDPACGSGAYLLGMLHELLDLRQALFAKSRLDPITTYERKLEIIQTSLYGVDIDPFAVNIARLRLWLSLAVDFDGPKPEPLPNLDFKIEAGDSVTGPAPVYIEEANNISTETLDAIHSSGHVGSLMESSTIRDKFISEYMEAKKRFLTVQGSGKLQLRGEIESIKNSIQMLTKRKGVLAGFDWQIEFAEVFYERGGFDIIVANPPYVRQELIKELKPALKTAHPNVYTGVADLYVYFYSRALQLLRPGGMLAFISSNKWFRANYGADLREYIADTCQVLSITDFGDLPVFEGASAYPMIFIAEKGEKVNIQTRFTQVRSLESPYPDMQTIIKEQGYYLRLDGLNGRNWMLGDDIASARSVNMKASSVALNQYVGGKIYVGLKTGLNQAFWIDAATRSALLAQDPRSAEIIKPLVVGDEIRTWRIESRDKWLIYSPWNVEMDNYPAVKEHLTYWRAKLELRPECAAGRYRWWCMARYASGYADSFARPKIVFPDIAKEPRFALDTTGSYPDMTAFIIPMPDLYLLGVLNSAAVMGFFVEIGAQVRGGYLRFKRQYVEQIPIPNAASPDRMSIIDLVQQCLNLKGIDCGEFEKEINERVARLYGLSDPS